MVSRLSSRQMMNRQGGIYLMGLICMYNTKAGDVCS